MTISLSDYPYVFLGGSKYHIAKSSYYYTWYRPWAAICGKGNIDTESPVEPERVADRLCRSCCRAFDAAMRDYE